MNDVGLLPLHGLAGAPKIALLRTGELVMGRDPGGTGVKINDPRCSRRHAAFRTDGAAAFAGLSRGATACATYSDGVVA